MIIGVDERNDIWVQPDIFWQQADTATVVENMIALMDRYKPLFWWAEKGHISKSIGPFLRKRMLEKRVFCSIDEITPVGDKQTRAQSMQARMSMGKSCFPGFARWWAEAHDQMLKFPQGAHDDFVDTLSLFGIGLYMQRGQRLRPRRPRSRSSAPWLGDRGRQARAQARTRRSDDGRLVMAVARQRPRSAQSASPTSRACRWSTCSASRKQNEDLLEREPPDPPEARKELVSQWCDKIKRAKKYWEPVFDRMKADQDFAAGYQWSKEEKDDRYTANLTLADHLPARRVLLRQEPQVRRAPAQAHHEHGVGRRPDDAGGASAGGGASLAAGGDGRDGPDDGAAGAAAGDAHSSRRRPRQAAGGATRQDRQDARTLVPGQHRAGDARLQADDEDDGAARVAPRASATSSSASSGSCRRSPTSSSASPTSRTGSRRSSASRADIHDDQTDENGPEAEQLRLLLQDLKSQMQVVVREGLTFDYPMSTSIIPDPKLHIAAGVPRGRLGRARNTSSRPTT